MRILTPAVLAATLTVTMLAGAELGLAAPDAFAADQADVYSADQPTALPVSHPAEVTVVGEGVARSAPDEAVVSAGVQATKPTADAAMSAAATAAAAMLAALRAQGVADRDVATTDLTLNPDSVSDSGVTRVTGYTAGQSFRIVVRDIARVGAVVQAATTAVGDAGRLDGISFDLADHTALRAAARDAAFTDARADAAQYAHDAGLRLGRLISLSEASGGPGRPVLPFPAAPAAAGLRVAPGEVTEDVSVTAVFELD